MEEDRVFSRLVRVYRMGLGLTQEELADRAGLGVRTVRNLEAGRTGQPRQITVRILADVFGLDPADRRKFSLAATGNGGIAQDAPARAAGSPRTASADPARREATSTGPEDPAAAGAGHPDRDGHPAGPAFHATPAQLPAEVSGFAGRAAEMIALDRLLEEAARRERMVICAVSGTAGVGKSALVVNWAHRVTGRFPDGQLYVNLRGFDPAGRPSPPDEAVRGFLDALGVPPERIPASLDAKTALYRSLLAGKQILVVLDNAADADQVRPLLPGTPGCMVVAASRNQLTSLVAGEGATPLALRLLSGPESRELLARRLGADRVADEPAAAERIIACCARLPLALAVTAARAQQTGFTLRAIAAELAEASGRPPVEAAGPAGASGRVGLAPRLGTTGPAGPDGQPGATGPARPDGQPGTTGPARPDGQGGAGEPVRADWPPGPLRCLDALDAGDASTQVRAVFSWSYTALSAPAARLFRLLGLHPGPDVSAPAVASLAALSPGEAGLLLRDLVRANLLTEHVPGRFCFHDLLRAYAAQVTAATDAPPARRAAAARLLDHYTYTAYAANRLVYPQRESIAMPLGTLTGGTRPEWFVDRAEAIEWLTTEHTVLLAAIRQAVGLGFDLRAWQLAWSLDTVQHLRGDWQAGVEACTSALIAGERLGSAVAQAEACRNLGVNHYCLGHDAEAGRFLLRALDLFALAGDRLGQARVRHDLSMLATRQGDPTQALRHAERALALVESIDHGRARAILLNAVGWCHALLGDHAQALDFCGRALPLHQEAGDACQEANTWDSLGYANVGLGRHGEAVECYQRALALFRDMGHRFLEARTLENLGDAHRAGNAPDAARAAWKDALDVYAGIDHPDACPLRAKLGALETP